jgi:N-acyl-D-amino-acid deacylase
VVTRADLKGKKTVDATGKIVCPGFVDPHSHADGQIFSAQVMANMGVTSIVIGSCGVGPYPTRGFLESLYDAGYPINCGVLTPESWRLRDLAGIKGPYEAATDRQIAMMADWVEQDLLEGAMGVSFGLEYAPKTSWEEMVAIAKVAAKYDKPVPIHSRAGGWNGLAATREIIRLQETTGARVLISHHVYQCGQGMLAESLAIIDKAYRQGYKIAVDSGAYADFACPVGSEVFCEGWQQIYGCDYHDILAGTGVYLGQRLTEETFHELRRMDPSATVTAFVGKPHEVVLALRQPYTMISTDGGFPDLAPGRGHPQTAGTYPKILAEIVRDQDALSMMEFIKKATWMPAEFFGLTSKGWIGEGSDADLVIFDPKTIKDQAAYPGLGDPMAAPDGIEYVFVNGVPVIAEGILVPEARPGRAISSKARLWKM